MQFNNILRNLREEEKMTKKELAAKLNISPSAVSMYELGERTPSVDVLESIADYFNVDMDYLLGKQTVKRKISYDFLKQECELEAYFGMLSAQNNELDLEFMKHYISLDDNTKRMLIYFIEAQNLKRS